MSEALLIGGCVLLARVDEDGERVFEHIARLWPFPGSLAVLFERPGEDCSLLRIEAVDRSRRDPIDLLLAVPVYIDPEDRHPEPVEDEAGERGETRSSIWPKQMTSLSVPSSDRPGVFSRGSGAGSPPVRQRMLVERLARQFGHALDRRHDAMAARFGEECASSSPSPDSHRSGQD